MIVWSQLESSTMASPNPQVEVHPTHKSTRFRHQLDFDLSHDLSQVEIVSNTGLWTALTNTTSVIYLTSIFKLTKGKLPKAELYSLDLINTKVII